MFREHDFIIWGTYCKCGNECSILQNKHHPWDDTKFSIKVKCSMCNREVVIDKNVAERFYNDKIYSYFNNLHGGIIDLGCGGGFLSRHLIHRDSVDKVWGLDIDNDCVDELSDIIRETKNFEFKKYNGENLESIFNEKSVDFLVSRDVFMFIEDTEKYFDDVSKIVNKGIYQMGWYIKNNERMNNKLTPQQIKQEYSSRGWEVYLEYLDWYKSGYFIKADKKDNKI